MKFNKLLKLILVAVLLSIGGDFYAQVTIGGNKAPEAFSALEIISNQQRGLRMPHMTTQERNDMTDSSEFQAEKNDLAKGLTIYNTILDRLEFWNGNEWVSPSSYNSTKIGGSPIGLKAATADCISLGGTGVITPTNPDLVVGKPTQLTVEGFSNAISYQWYVNGVLIPEGTSSTFTYTPAEKDINNNKVLIFVLVQGCNNGGIAISNFIVSKPSGLCTPVSGTGNITPPRGDLMAGESVVFYAGNFTNATSYQWYVDDVLISEGTSSTFTYAPDKTGNVVIKVIALGCDNSSASASNTYRVVCIPMSGTGTLSPSSATVNVGDTQQFTVSGLSDVARYEWYVDNIFQSTTTSPTFTYTVPSGTASGLSIPVYVIAYDNCNNKQQLDANITTATACVPVTSVSISGATAYTVGGTISLTADITPANATAVFYQWYKDLVAIPGATGDTYTKASCTLSDAGSYTVLASNNCSFEVSPEKNITVTAACTTPVVSVTGGRICGTGTVSLSASATSGTIYWYTASSGGTSFHTGTSYTTPSISATTTYYVEAVDGTCISDRVPVTATINPEAVIISTTAGSTCGEGTVTLSATSNTEIIRWFATPTGGIILGNSASGGNFTTPSISSTTTFYAQAYNIMTGCTSKERTPVTATINELPTITSTTPGSRTGSGTVTLSATASGGSGVTIRWFSAATGGTLLGTGSSFTTPTISSTTTYYAQAYNMITGCVSSPRTPVVATVGTAPATPTVTGTTPNSRCGSGTVTLSATASTGATIRWYSTSTGGTSLGTGSSFITPTISSTTTYYAEAYNSTTGLVSSSRTAVTATVNALPTVTGTTPGSRTGSGTVTLSATASTGATIRWYSSSTGGTVLATGTSFTTPSISSTTTYYAEAYNSTTGCVSSSRTAVVATVNSAASAPTVTGSTNNSRCGSGTVTLSATASSGATIRWYSSSTGGTVLATSTSFTTPSISSTTTYYAEAYNSTTGLVSSSRTAVTATINALPATPTVTTPVTVAPNTTFILSATAPAGCTIDWYSTATGGTLLATGSSYVVNGGRPAGTYYYYAAARNTTTGCISASRAVVTVIVSAPTCDLGSARITMTGNTPIRPLTLSPDNYSGGYFSVTGLPSGASVTGWRIVANGSQIATYGAVNGFSWKPKTAPSGSHPMTVIATVRCSNGITAELSLNTYYGSICYQAGYMAEPWAYQFYSSGSGYVLCSGNNSSGWAETGRGCLDGWVFYPSERGCIYQGW